MTQADARKALVEALVAMHCAISDSQGRPVDVDRAGRSGKVVDLLRVLIAAEIDARAEGGFAAPPRFAAVSLVLGVGNILCVWNRRYGGWSLPGGMVEDGATPEVAQARELTEKTGLHTVAARLVHEGPHGLPHKPGRASRVKLYLVETVGEAREVEDGCPIAWKTVDEFLEQSPFREFYAPVLWGLVASNADFAPSAATEEETGGLGDFVLEGPPTIVAAEARAFCRGIRGRTHERVGGGVCGACGDYRPDWSWQTPTLATAFDDGRRYGLRHLEQLKEEVAKLGVRVRREDSYAATCCDPVYVKRNDKGERVSTTITLSEYHRANLLWLMCDVAGYDRPAALVPGLNTGDWNGEIPNALRVREDGLEYEESARKPNASGDPEPLAAMRHEVETLRAKVAELQDISEHTRQASAVRASRYDKEMAELAGAMGVPYLDKTHEERVALAAKIHADMRAAESSALSTEAKVADLEKLVAGLQEIDAALGPTDRERAAHRAGWDAMRDLAVKAVVAHADTLSRDRTPRSNSPRGDASPWGATLVFADHLRSLPYVPPADVAKAEQLHSDPCSTCHGHRRVCSGLQSKAPCTRIAKGPEHGAHCAVLCPQCMPLPAPVKGGEK